MEHQLNRYEKSREIFERATKVIPSGIYGHQGPAEGCFIPVDAFPFYAERAKGSYFWDVDGNRYIDYIGSWGPMILGHNHPAIREAVIKAAEKGLSFGAATGIEEEVAELICDMVPSVEMLRMVNSGTG